MSLLEPYVPEDFDDFWAKAVADAAREPLEMRRSFRNDYDWPGFQVEKIEFRASGGRILKGWFAAPAGARRLPAYVWLPPYGRTSMLPNEYGTREGHASLSFNYFGEDAFHEEAYVQERGYFAEGAGSPETWIFRRMLQDAWLAVRGLQAQVEVDEDRIGAMGLSQGGGMSIWLGALCPAVRAVAADMPFLGGMRETLAKSVYRYPLKELTDFIDRTPLGPERVMNTISYFDTVNMATRCRVPTQVSLGLRDPATRPENVQAVYDALPGHKALITYDWGHDWHPEMVENNRRWLDQNLA